MHVGDVLRLLRSAVFVSLAASTTVLYAQKAPGSLQEFVLTPGYRGNLSRLFSQLPPDVFQRCPTLVSAGSAVTVIQPMVFAADGYPTAGIWRQSFPVSGCGNDTTINFFFKAGPDEKIVSLVAMPGATHAGLLLQRDAVNYVMLAVHARAKDCPAPHVRTTTFIGTASGAATSGKGDLNAAPWHEVWTVSACGQSYDVPLTFIPDATGTTISAAPAQPSRQ